ncbi:MAG: hypothetical protein OXG11_09990, partial [Chloroflexi bacterium]|nr:hypothetical protein [Chloroflexota bacterium]
MIGIQPLVISRYDVEHPHSRYLVEILAAEGFNSVRVMAPEQVRELPRPDRSGCVIVAQVPLGRDLRDQLLTYIRSGGGAVLMRPDAELARALGLQPRGSHPGGYLWPVAQHPLCPAKLPPYMQFHGGAEFYEAASASPIALFGSKEEAGTSPAIATGRYGQGRFAVFAYDLAASTVIFHQGRPEQSSTGPDWPGNPTSYYTPADMFTGLLDFDLRHVPQADFQQRMFSRAAEWVYEPTGPLPRLWYYPHAARALQFLNGDGDSMRHDELVTMIDLMEKYDAPYAAYLMMDDHPKVAPAEVAEWMERGHSFGQHVWAGPRPSPDELDERITWETQQFRSRYGFTPLTTRNHCVIWTGWVDTAKSLERNGVRLDLNYRAAHDYRDGYLTGSGLPMRFMDENGAFIDVYEQETLTRHRLHPLPQTPHPGPTVDEAVDVSRQYLPDAVESGHTVVHQYFHPVYARTDWDRPYSPPWLEGTLQAARELNVPAVGADRWVHFNAGRPEPATDLVNWDQDPSGLG